MAQVDAHRDASLGGCPGCHGGEVLEAHILLDDARFHQQQGGFELLCTFDEEGSLIQGVEVERADGVFTPLAGRQHIHCFNKCHDPLPAFPVEDFGIDDGLGPTAGEVQQQIVDQHDRLQIDDIPACAGDMGGEHHVGVIE